MGKVTQNENLRTDNKYLKETIEGNNLALKHSHKQNRELRAENKELHTEIGSLKAHIRDLQSNIKFYINKRKKSLKSNLRRL
ncbi:hypothetical protein C6352_27005 [Bacillus thuringiensis]|uniref:Uncharacterized protein n=1 Tax=Bacillus wiedmannii TaxID=1890302 RepID=A0ABX5DN60_9BACI|nr:hypothetical protein [Bacillus wiedmannii]PRT04347.1 hypothetical protein C6352_27005 [Bacillus thuringiensis]PRT36983.1 hypothetical protein C6357_26870 [Bacillus wiedmannii]